MLRAFYVGIVISILASVLGMFVVVRRYSMLSDSLAHISLLGVAAGFLTAMPIGWSSVLFTLFVSWIIEYLRQNHKLYSDSVLSIFLSGSLALAIIIVSLSSSFNISIFDYLFGSIVAIEDEDVYLISSVGILCIVLFVINYQKLLFIAFDEDVAKASGVNTKVLNYALISMVAITIGISIKIIGALLIGALMVVPAVTAMQFGRNFISTLLLGMVLSIFSVIAGLFLSFYVSLPSGATIVVILIAIFIFTILRKVSINS